MSTMQTAHPVLQLGLALVLLAAAGCTKGPKPGVTFDVTVIARGSDGQVTPQGPPTHFESAVVQTVREISHDGQTLSLLIRKTEYAKGTFEITFPDKKTQMVKVEDHEMKDILPEGQKIGVRIAVDECH
jgi:hypothetical protein